MFASLGNEVLATRDVTARTVINPGNPVRNTINFGGSPHRAELTLTYKNENTALCVTESKVFVIKNVRFYNTFSRQCLFILWNTFTVLKWLYALLMLSPV